MAADAVRPDGCALAADGETHGDAPLRARIIYRAHNIFLIADYVSAAVRLWEHAGIFVLYQASVFRGFSSAESAIKFNSAQVVGDDSPDQ